MNTVTEESPPEWADRTYLRPRDVARATGLSRSAVMAALWSGELPGYRRGRAWLIPVKVVDPWIRGQSAA
jgi:excisionase family DNA binding protein